ncbi:MAG: cytochrome c biogenesis protein ResB, partial [Desulfobulbaceae bacterium]|nr:cytochrome c biogenesis protein ResB [Desulfobulbaceae bacterium]
AATSIIGTIIPQNESSHFYIGKYGKGAADFMNMLDIPDMYTSWWFLALLGAFCINLLVCSLDRIPTVWKIVKRDNLATALARLGKSGPKAEFTVGGDVKESADKVANSLQGMGWGMGRRDRDGGLLLFSQKGAWTRFGVYIVHLSILVIMLGAVIGSPMIGKNIFKTNDFAFKGNIMLPEFMTADELYSFAAGESISLGFTVRCDFFDIEFYDNGMVKDYLSHLAIVENGQDVVNVQIEVNQPLTYKGVTFYQSSYRPLDDFVVDLENPAGVEQTFVSRAEKQIHWKDGGASFGIINMKMWGETVSEIKVWFTDNQGKASTFWIELGREAVVKRPSGNFVFKAKQRYATGLQVVKDPGVWYVYTGCGLMLIGLFVAFFMSHRKIWAYVREEDDGRITVLLTGNANKNKLGFEKTFDALADELRKLS